jgi:hypothetical protein
MTAAWPGNVNTDVLRQGYSEQDIDERETFQPEKGEPITWLSPFVEGTGYQITIRCTTIEKLVLKEFYRDRLGNGVLPFYRPDPATKETALFTFRGPIVWSEVALNIWDGNTTLLRMP